MCAIKLFNNIFLILFFCLSVVFGEELNKWDIPPNGHVLTQHGNLVCKGELESKNMKTTRNGHLYTDKVKYSN